jgi:hypothetical protein
MEQPTVSSEGGSARRAAELEWSQAEAASADEPIRASLVGGEPPTATAPAGEALPLHANVAASAVSLHFVCTDCGRRSPLAADCPCGAGAFVDIDLPQFRAMVVEIEDRRLDGRKQRLLWAGVGIGVASVIGILVTVPSLILDIPLPVLFANPIKVVLLMIGVAVGSTRLLEAMFPAKRLFPELVAARPAVALPSRLHAVKRSTWIAIAGFVAFSIALSVAVPIVSAKMDVDDRDHRKAVATKFEALDDCMVDEYAEVCGKQLKALYEALDTRREDMALKSTLEAKLGCESVCKTSALDTSFGDVRGAAVRVGIAREGSFRDFRPRARQPKLGAIDTRFGLTPSMFGSPHGAAPASSSEPVPDSDP